MQITSDAYKDLLLRGATKEVRVEIGGEIYGEDRLVEMSTSGSLFSAETLCVGSAVSSQIDLTVVNYGSIPRMAKIVPSYRLVLDDEVSEWIQKGVYYIDTRQPDKASGTLKIHGFDAMLKGSVIWEPDQSLVFPMTRRAAASVIASLMGVELDNPEDIDNTQAIVDYPANDYTQRNILQFIAASHAANFVMTDSGKLRMVTINDLPAETGFMVNEVGNAILIGGIRVLVSDTLTNKVTGDGSKVFVGQNVESTGAAPSFAPISKIIVKVDDENAWVSGKDGGTVLEVACPYGSQAMANELLAKVGGFVYQPFTADGALVDNAIELGDGITVDGVYTMLAKQEIVFDGLMAGSVSAPGECEVESEYPYQTREQQIEYKLASTRSLISKTAEEIRLEVNGLDGKYTSLAVTIDGVTVTDSTGTTKIKGSSIETSTLKVNAANITGTLTVGNLPAGVAMTSDIPSDAEITVITNNAIRTANINANQITAGTFTGRKLVLDGLLTINGRGYIGGGIGGANGMQTYGAVLTDLTASNGILATNAGAKLFSSGYELSVHNTGVTSYGSLWPGTTGAYNLGSSNFRWSVMYADSSNITTSDRGKKNDISYEMEKYEALYSLLRPVSYKFDNGTSGRNHVGFISQDVETAIEESGLTSLDFAGFIKSPKIDENGESVLGQYDYALRYEEFIALNTHMIQRLMERVSALEAKG